MKIIFDLCLSICLLFLLSPILVILIILVRLKLGKPIFFRQERSGLLGKPFYIYKFRTMTDKRDENGQLLPDEKRLTNFGMILRKLSLDELPQLYNVILGEMSLVGPRPQLMEYLPLYNSRQIRRMEVKPGITGWAQVNGRNAISWEEKFELDVWYVDNRSFALDLKILWTTVVKVIKMEGISQKDHVTVEKFRGSALT